MRNARTQQQPVVLSVHGVSPAGKFARRLDQMLCLSKIECRNAQHTQQQHRVGMRRIDRQAFAIARLRQRQIASLMRRQTLLRQLIRTWRWRVQSGLQLFIEMLILLGLETFTCISRLSTKTKDIPR